MSFKWHEDQEDTLEFTHELIEEENIVKVSCNADNPGCTNRGKKEIKLCWDIMNELVYSDGVFFWSNKKYFLSECLKCKNNYIMEEFQKSFICEECKIYE